MIVELIGVSVVGRLVIFLVGQLPATKKMRIEFWNQLFNCDLCLGVWVFFIFCGLFHFEIISGFIGVYVPIVNELLSGAIISFIVHLIVLGWKLKFSEFTIVE